MIKRLLLGVVLLVGCATTVPVPTMKQLAQDTNTDATCVFSSVTDAAVVFVCTHGVYIVDLADPAHPDTSELRVRRVETR